MRSKVRIGGIFLALAALSLGRGAGAESVSALQRGQQAARVVWVTDGDTITVRVGDRSEKVRLVGIDAPEVHDEREPWRRAALAASEYLRGQLKGRTVTLEADGVQKDRDDYGRLLRYVYLEGRNLNLELVRLGYARVYRRFGCRLKTELLAAESEARRKKLGVWSLPPGPPRMVH